MERLKPYEVYEIKPSAGSFPAISLGESPNPQKKNKNIILCRSGNGKPKLYCFDEYVLNGMIVTEVCLRDHNLKRHRDDPIRGLCKGLLERKKL